MSFVPSYARMTEKKDLVIPDIWNQLAEDTSKYLDSLSATLTRGEDLLGLLGKNAFLDPRLFQSSSASV